MSHDETVADGGHSGVYNAVSVQPDPLRVLKAEAEQATRDAESQARIVAIQLADHVHDHDAQASLAVMHSKAVALWWAVDVAERDARFLGSTP